VMRPKKIRWMRSIDAPGFTFTFGTFLLFHGRFLCAFWRIKPAIHRLYRYYLIAARSDIGKFLI